MILPIYTYGQPVLRKVAEDIDANYPELKQLVETRSSGRLASTFGRA